MSVREANKNMRRRAIMDAARALILEDKSRDFSMPALAERAGVSLATSYNLFGAKSDILLEIVREDIFERQAEIDALQAKTLASWIGGLATVLARVFYSKRHFYRRMIVTLTAAENPNAQRASLALFYRIFEQPIANLMKKGWLIDTVPAAVLAQHLAHCVSGSLQLRLMERGAEETLRDDIDLAILLLLGGLSHPKEAAEIRARVAELAATAPQLLTANASSE